METLRTSWREDRRNVVAVALLAFALVLRLATAHDTYTWVSAIVLVLLTGWLAVTVFVVRPRRLERTGRRDKPRR